MRLFNHFVFLYLLFVCLCNVAKSFPTSICISTPSNKEQRLTNNGSSLWVSLILINRPPPYFLPILFTVDSHLILRTISVSLSAMSVVDLQNHWIQNLLLAYLIIDYFSGPIIVYQCQSHTDYRPFGTWIIWTWFG